MSWEIVNRVLGLAALDPDFREELLKNPIQAVQKRGFTLSQEEKEVLSKANTDDIVKFSQYILEHLDRDV